MNESTQAGSRSWAAHTDPARLAAIDALFEAALDLDGEARAALLAERAAADPELAREVESLLALTDEESVTLIDSVRSFVARVAEESSDDGDDVAEGHAGGAEGLAAGETVGAYTIVETLGRGGMGVVYLAERTDKSFEQRVALKVLPFAASTPEAIRRFEQERRIVARLEHPSIARLLDGGVDPRGLPYLVLERVEGVPIDRHCDRERLTIDERIRLVIETARAVQVAHRNLVVHRDLKAENLLVTADGRVKLLDFGIAKLLEPTVRPSDGADGQEPSRALDPTALTAAAALTPSCASPEQVRGEPISTASDVYQLGLLLYSLVTGHRPQPASFRSLSELVEIVCEREPPAPSRAVLNESAAASASALAELRHSTPAKLARRLAPDLDAIVARALDKRPERRYPTADELALDLERFLAGLPVEARAAGRTERARKWIARNPALAAALAASVLLAAVYAVTVTAQARALAAERDRARLEAAKASEVERFVLSLFEVSDPAQSRGKTIDAIELLERGAKRIDQELSGQPEVQARLLSTLGRLYGRLGRFEEGRELEGRSLALRRELHGEHHPEVAESLHRAGALARLHGDHAAATPLLEEAVALRRELLDPHAPELAESLTELGNLRYFDGDYAAARPLFDEALEIRRAGDDANTLAAAWNSVALVAEAQGDLDRAEPLYREALAANRAALGNEHPDVAINLFNLARVLQRRERYTEAQPLFEEVLAIDRVVYGAEHPEVATDLTLLANNLQILGRLDEADRLFAQGLAIYRAKLEPNHPRIATTLQGIGQLRLAQKRLPEAEQLLREALAMRRGRVGDSHVEIAQLLLPIGQVQVAAGHLDEARATWESALVMTRGKEPVLTKRLESELAKLTAKK